MAGALSTGHDFGTKVLEALGIDWRARPVQSLTLHIDAGKLVTVDVVYLQRQEAEEPFIELLERCTLVPRDGTPGTAG